jgi:hypothetical protein
LGVIAGVAVGAGVGVGVAIGVIAFAVPMPLERAKANTAAILSLERVGLILMRLNLCRIRGLATLFSQNFQARFPMAQTDSIP